MATYDFSGMFGDRYSTQQAINDAMFKDAYSFGSLDRSKYAPMTASSYGQAYMGSAGIAGLLGGQHPMMKRQNLLDEIQKKFPDPRTPAELNELAEELSKNGFGDLAMQVRQVAMEMSKNEATKAYQTSQLGTPSSDDLKKIGRRLQGSILTTDVIDSYLQIVEPELVVYNDKTYKAGKQNWNDRRDSRIAEVKSLIQQFSDNKQVSGFTKQMIDEAVGDSGVLTEEFIAWIMTSGNATTASNLLDAMGRDNPYKDKDGDDSDGTTTTTTSQTSADVGSVVTEGAGQTESTTNAKQQSMAKTATTVVGAMSDEAKQQKYEELSLKKFTGTSVITLQPYEEELYRQLSEALGMNMKVNYQDGAWWAAQ